MFRPHPSPPTSSDNRPQLSPRSMNGVGAEQASYFIPPTPGAGGNGGEAPTGWPGSSSRTGDQGGNENDGGFFGGGRNGFNFAGESANPSHEGGSTSRGATTGGNENSWASTAPPHFALSPSSTAFNAKFNRLGGFAGSYDIPPTPLYPPAQSPFIPPDAQSQQNPFDVASTPSTSGPDPTTSSFQPPSSSTSSPKFNFAIPSAATRKLAPRPSLRSSPVSSATAPSPSAAATSRFTPILPTTLFSLLQTSLASSSTCPPLLVLDIRTHTAYLSQRLSNSINVCVPSTLLRRPGFGVERVQDGLPEHEQEVFAAWNSCETIVAIDAESTTLGEGSSGVASLLSKFERAGFKGKLGWIKGGWYAIKTQARGLPKPEQAKLFQSGSGSPAESTPTSPNLAAGSATPGDQQFNLNQPPQSKKHGRPVLQVRDLPIAAFQLASTSAFVHSGLPSSNHGVSVTSPSSDGSSSSRRPNLGKRRKSSNDPSSMDQSGFTLGSRDALPTPIGESPVTPKGIMGDTGRNVQGAKKMSSNPFFDNIRQNSEVCPSHSFSDT